jgi:hypothetical protein
MLVRTVRQTRTLLVEIALTLVGIAAIGLPLAMAIILLSG